jgi:DNA-binding NarL/FixJ family response regulator
MTPRADDDVENLADIATGQYGSVRTGILSGRSRSERTDTLTRRELEVLELVAEGLTNGEIGDRLVVSARTIQAHVRNLVEKTGTRNRTHLAVTAVRTGIIK